MASISPFQVFKEWMFDGSNSNPIPEPKFDSDGKVIIPDICKYNSPINPKYVMKMFIRVGPLNHYLNEYFNNVNLWKIETEDFLYFIKKCVNELRVRHSEIIYFRSKKDSKLYDELRQRMPHLKSYEVTFLCDKIEKSPERESIYETLGLEVPKKEKIKKTKLKSKKLSVEQLLRESFSIVR
jgi:hypothetical protein